MIEEVKKRLAGLTTAIDVSNKQGCSVQLKQRNQLETFTDRIEFYFSKISKVSEFRYNINPSIEPSVSDLDFFDFAEDRFILEDLLGLVLEHVDIREQNHLTEFIVILKESELMDEADFQDLDTEHIGWAWDFIESTFRGLYKNGKELEAQRLYFIEDGKFHIHIKLLEVKGE